MGTKDRISYGETRRIFDSLEKFHKVNTTLFRVEKETSLGGIKLLDPKLDLRTDTNLLNFIKLCVSDKADEYLWRVRQ